MKEVITSLKKIAFVGDYLPRKCGIATFTHELRQAVAKQFVKVDCQVVAVTDPFGDYDYPPEVSFEVAEAQLGAYRRAAEFLQFQDVDCICVQHEFGIYGGVEGSHLLTFLRELNLPIVTTCHTLLESLTPNQNLVFQELTDLSHRLVAMSARGKKILMDSHGVAEDKIATIPHGIPDVPFVEPALFKDQFGVEGKKVLLTFGLLSPGKGLEYAIGAMPEIVRAHPEAVYIILGATHPNLARLEGEAYRYKLQQLAKDLKVEENVLFFNRFVGLQELTEFIGACDVYLTPYLNPAQITSGTLAYTFGCGKAIVSTPYWHAEELLADGRGRLVPFKDAKAIAREVNSLLGDETVRDNIRKAAYRCGREMVWGRVAQSYMEVFRQARKTNAGRARLDLMQERPIDLTQLPDIRLDHVRRLTDSTGIFQHATFTFPNFGEGYCIDDNARALILTSKLEDLRYEAADLADLSRTYAAFINHAFNAKNGHFRNFMDFDRSWLEESGSDDSHGRALWALGTCVAYSSQKPLQNWAANLFEVSLPTILETTSPRAWAFALIGLHEYLRRMGGQRRARMARQRLAGQLLDLFRDASSREWLWFEPILSYDNAKLSHALIVSGDAMQDEQMRQVGLDSLRWLMMQQTAENGYFRPIGSDGFFPEGGARAEFDQQPIDAHSSVAACLEAYFIARDKEWLEEALRAFRWFLGSNKLGEQLYDPITGGCRDGLHLDRPNQNEGAESTLAFLLSLTEIQCRESTLGSFLEPVDWRHEPADPIGSSSR